MKFVLLTLCVALPFSSFVCGQNSQISDKALQSKQLEITKREPAKIPVTSKEDYRLLILEGEQGSIACRVRGESSKVFPRLSKGGNFEFMYRTRARLRNITAVRGTQVGTRMLGPCDYFGNLEMPHKYKYTIHIENGIPLFLRQKKGNDTLKTDENLNKLSPSGVTTQLRAEWISAKALERSKNQTQALLGDSLFPNKGILKIPGGHSFCLKKFDATQVDLSSFKATLVHNHTPFQITTKRLPPSDEYRVVTYFYEPSYADYQVNDGGGLFLETHTFAQSMTPLNKHASGFVTLAKWTDNQKDTLELLAVEIPFGYTLIIHPECIHGDTNLNGMYMMCMTSNHRTMKKADTVFLKNAESLNNIRLCTVD